MGNRGIIGQTVFDAKGLGLNLDWVEAEELKIGNTAFALLSPLFWIPGSWVEEISDLLLLAFHAVCGFTYRPSGGPLSKASSCLRPIPEPETLNRVRVEG